MHSPLILPRRYPFYALPTIIETIRSLSLELAVAPFLLGFGIRVEASVDQIHALEQVEVYADGFFVDLLVADLRLADPVGGLLLQEYPE